MKKAYLFYPLLALAVSLGTSCSKYDDGALTGRIDKVEERMGKMEESIKTMNADIQTLRTLANVLEHGDYVTHVEPFSQGERSGYRIHFTKSPSVTIYHGENGATGSSPIIGIRQYEGVYYWTINDSWMTDAGGKWVRAQGVDGVDAKTPQLRIEAGQWQVSYDSGASWQQLDMPVRGPQGAVGAPGQSGAAGDPGSPTEGDVHYFTALVDTPEELSITLANGTTLRLPRLEEAHLSFEGAESLALFPQQSIRVKYQGRGLRPDMSIKAIAKGGYVAQVVAQGQDRGYIEIKTPEKITDGEVLVLLSDQTGYFKVQTILLHEGVLELGAKTYLAEQAGFILDVPVTTNTQYEVEIELGVDWISRQEARALATRQETLRLVIARNHSDKPRTAVVRLRHTGKVLQQFVVVQQGERPLILGEAGRLERQLSGKPLPERLSITGTLAAEDFAYLRHISGEVKTLDLSELNMDSLPEAAFMHSRFEFVSLPKKLSTIPMGLFAEAKELRDVGLPQSVRTIEPRAFYGCSTLEYIHLPDELERIGMQAFENCSNLRTNLKLPYTLREIGTRAFRGCTSLNDELILPKSLRVVEDEVFADCSNISGQLLIPAHIEAIGRGAFRGCSNIQTVAFSEGLRSIGAQAFMKLSNVRGPLALPNSLKRIGASAFENSSFDGQLILPKGLQSIAARSFASMPIRGTLQLPEGLTQIEQEAFIDCRNLTELRAPEGLRSIGAGAFKRCFLLTGTLPNSVEYIEGEAFYDTSILSRDTELPSSLRWIGPRAFHQSQQILRGREYVSLSLPASLEVVREEAFAGNRFSGVNFSDRQIAWWPRPFAYSSFYTLSFPQGMTHIPAQFYAHCKVGAKKIEIPEGVTHIGTAAFFEVPIEAIVLPSTLQRIEEQGLMTIDHENSPGECYVWSKASTPPELAPNAFRAMPASNALVLTTEEDKARYESNPAWRSTFSNIGTPRAGTR